jgi:hypothetical protein
LTSGCWYLTLQVGTNPTEATGGAGGAASSTSTGGAGGGPACVPGAVRSCYDGPAGTEGQGICAAGTQACASDGASWGPCAGEVLPQMEDCATPEDDDCDGLAPACQGKVLWAERFGDVASQYARAIAVDPSGNVVVVGEANGALDFGGGPISPPALFVVKLDPAGKHLWTRSFTTGGRCSAVAVGNGGDISVTGSFSGSVDFGGGPLTAGASSSKSMFVLELDAAGHHLWSKSFGDAAEGMGLAVDEAGDILLAGSYSGSPLNLGGAPLAVAGDADAFAAKLGGATGNHKWSLALSPSGADVSVAVAAGPGGSAVLAGSFIGQLTFGAKTLVNVGLGDMFVAMLDPTGNPLWSDSWGTAGKSIGATGVAADGAGDIWLTGGLSGSVVIGGGTLTSVSPWDTFAAKLDANGKAVFSRDFGGPWIVSEGPGPTVAVDKHGNALFAGPSKGVLDFGGGQIPGAGGMDAYLAKLTGNGDHVWSRRFGDAQEQRGTGVAADGEGNVLLLGELAGSANLGVGPLTSAGGTDIFIAKFSP